MKSLPDRRTFLKDAGTLTASVALFAASALAFASDAAAQDTPRISAVVYDSRYSSCREFADGLGGKGADPFDTCADVAGLWYGPLRGYLAAHGGGVAGLTTYSDSGVSESFGRELHLSLVYEGLHDSRGSHVLTHRLRGVGDAIQIGSALSGQHSDWAEALGYALARARSTKASIQWESSVVHTSQIGDHPGFLRSWLLEPISPGRSFRG
jgi:hypothetical protein